MTRFEFTIASILSAALVSFAADEKKPEPKTAEATDWSKYATVSEIVGEISKVEKGGGLLIEVPGPPQMKTTGSGNNKKTTMVPGKPEKVSVMFAEGGLVRWKALPPKLDSNGKKLTRTFEETQLLKLPAGTPGYTADRSDLKAGQIVEFVMVRPKEIPAAKATPQDLLVKRATILGEDPNAKPAAPPKKKN